MADFITTVLFVLIITLSIVYIKLIIQRRGKKYPNGPFGLPIVGHLPFYGSYPPATFFKWWQEYGDVFRIKLGSWNTVVLNGYSTIKEATNHPKDAFSGRPNFLSMQILKERINDDIFSFGNFSPVYVKQQKLAASSLRLFTSGRPDVIEDLVSQETSLFIDKMLKQCGTVPGHVQSNVHTMALRFVFQLLYGKEQDVDFEPMVDTMTRMFLDVDEFNKSGSPIDVIPWLKYFMPWKVNSYRKLFDRVFTIQEEQVHEHYKTFSRGEIRDVADAILASDADDEMNEDRFVLTRNRLNYTLTDFLGAGFDTTNKTIMWTLLYLTAYPDVQRRVYEEIDEVASGRNVTLKDKKHLPFTDAVCYEVSRIVTQVPFSVPHYAIMDAKIGDYDIDEGTVVILNLHSVHNDPKFWVDPECFRPDRFLTNTNKLDPEKCSHVIPFGIGRRKCVGEHVAKMNIFLTISSIMQRLEFIKPPGETLDLASKPGLVYFPNDFKVLVKERL